MKRLVPAICSLASLTVLVSCNLEREKAVLVSAGDETFSLPSPVRLVEVGDDPNATNDAETEAADIGGFAPDDELALEDFASGDEEEGLGLLGQDPEFEKDRNGRLASEARYVRLSRCRSIQKVGAVRTLVLVLNEVVEDGTRFVEQVTQSLPSCTHEGGGLRGLKLELQNLVAGKRYVLAARIWARNEAKAGVPYVKWRSGSSDRFTAAAMGEAAPKIALDLDLIVPLPAKAERPVTKATDDVP